MKRHALQHNVAAIAMPRIGCGLDGLVWDRVREILTDVYKDTDIKISVYSIWGFLFDIYKAYEDDHLYRNGMSTLMACAC